MIAMEQQDWHELMNILKSIDDSWNAGSPENDPVQRLAFSQQMLQTFHTTAAMLGHKDLEQAGICLARHMSEADSAQGGELPSRLIEAVNTVRSAMQATEAGSYDSLKVAEKIDSLLGRESITPREDPLHASALNRPGSSSALSTHEKADIVPHNAGETGETGEKLDFGILGGLVKEVGGDLIFSSDPESGRDGYFYLRFRADSERLRRIQAILSLCSRESSPSMPQGLKDMRIERIFESIREFMTSISQGDLRNAQEILKSFSERQENNAELFVEIGTLARDLHNSLKGFMMSIDPALQELVEDKLPDSGNRLEHILHLTEKAANTTLDHVELIKRRNDRNVERLGTLREMHGHLTAIGDRAEMKLSACQRIIEELSDSLSEMDSNLTAILTAQDYQDLTGQIIIKIINLLNELQLKLVNLVRTFGAVQEEKKAGSREELYGPAHQGIIEALHSQDDVDNLLAEFGF